MLAPLIATLLAQDCGLEPPRAFPPVPAKAFEATASDPVVVRRVRGQTPINAGTPQPQLSEVGALAGKTVYLSPGHGFTWEAGSINGWRTQRGTTHQLVEDLVSIEVCAQWLMPLLINAGARVVPVRELDLTAQQAVVDDGAQGYAEHGGGFSTSTLAGYGAPAGPLPTGTNPFALGANRLMAVAATATASATYAASLPADGEYNVYVSYTAYSARAPDAHYVVKHPGGEAHFRVDQRRSGGTWVFLGRFYFRASAAAVVEVRNDSTSTGTQVSLDAVRFGGGMGVIDRGGGVSGRPRNEESARYHAQLSGAPTSVYDYSDTDHNDDIGTRSRFAKWVHEPGEDAVYLAWHTNAGGGTGTELYVYGANPPNGTYQFSGVVGSDTLARALHDELINDIRAGYGLPMWRDRGLKSAYFGELNPSHNDEMPAVLMEIAFHDLAADAAVLKEPAFRYLAARAVTQGVIRYFAQRAGTAPEFPPEPVHHLVAAGAGPGQVTVRWRAAPVDTTGVGGYAATKYRVYGSDDGRAWDEGVETAGTSVSVSTAGLRYFRVTALNAGGESFPSPTVAARPGAKRVLIVNAFDRLEASLAQTEDLSAYTLGQVLRVVVRQLNDGSYVRAHADALSAAPLGVDSATTDALQDGEVTASAYAAIDFIAGRGHPGGAGVTPLEAGALGGGVPLFFTGAPVAGPTFLTQTLHVASSSTMSSPTLDGVDFLEGLSELQLTGAYLAGTPSALAPANATVVARYQSGTAAGVGVPGTVVTFGFPFETVGSRAQRVEVMGRVMKYLGAVTEVPDAGPPGPEPDGGQVVDPPQVLLPTLSPALGDEAQRPCGCAGAAPGVLPLALLAWLAGRRRRAPAARRRSRGRPG